jgi:hypothetical protein
MAVNDLVQAVSTLNPTQIVEFFTALSTKLSARAESVYATDPESAGVLAQPYADLADLCEEASHAFANKDDVLSGSEAGDVFTQTAEDDEGLVRASAPKRAGSPWGGR